MSKNIWRFNFVISQINTITVVADTEAQARAAICDALDGDQAAKERVTFHPPSPFHHSECPVTCASFDLEPERVAKFQRQRVRIADASFLLDFEGDGA